MPVYFLRDDLGGTGPKFTEAVRQLRERFPYHKWRVQSGEFCGAFDVQDPTTKEISMSQQTFAENIRPAHIAKGADNEQPLQDSQIR